jgi:hypothetical protein
MKRAASVSEQVIVIVKVRVIFIFEWFEINLF